MKNLKALVVLISVLSVSGCATQAKKQNEREVKEFQQAAIEREECFASIGDKVELSQQKLATVGLVRFTNITLKERMIEDTLPDKLKEAFLEVAIAYNKCTDAYVSRAGAALPLHTATYSKALSRINELRVQLLKSEISIGEYNTKIVGAINTFESEFAVVDANYVKGVNAQIQRQAAIRQQALHSAIQGQQNQSLINAMKQSNRKPQNLICNTIGTVTTCN